MNKDLEIVKALIKEMNEELKGGQKKIDVAPPFGKITGADFKKLRSMKKEGQSNLPQSIEELPKHDGLYHIGGIINYDGSPWVSKADAEKALAMAKAEENSIKEDTSDLSYQAGYGAGARYGYDKGYNDCAAGKKYDQTGISKVRENHEGTDHEVSMANNSLDSILWAANELKKYLGDQERDIPAWIQDHITNAENYILQAAKNFHDYGDKQAEIPNDMSLEEMIKKVGSKYNVYSKKGKKLGSHPSKKKAQKQMAAIEISKQGK